MLHITHPRVIFLSITLLNSFSLPILSQSSLFLPAFKVRSAVITYNMSFPGAPDASSHPFLRMSFDRFGEFQSKEYIDETSMLMNDGPFREIFRNDEIFILDNRNKIATKYRISYDHYMSGGDEGFIKLSQDLVAGKINKSNTPNFTSFKRTGDKTFLGLPCQTYEYSFESSSSNDKMELTLYHDICLSKKYYIQDSLYYVIEAESYSDNITGPFSVFDVPEGFRIIDGDKLETTKEESNYPYSTVVVEYSSVSNVGQIKQEGKKTLYIKNNGENSCEEFTGTLTQFNLPPENKHTKDIHDQEYEYIVDYNNQNVTRRMLVEGNYDDKSIAGRNYIFSYDLYDNSVKLLGKTNFLGKECRILEFRIMSQKLEVLEWSGIFLKTKKYMCYDNECSQSVLLLEETASGISINIPVDNSVFIYPEDYQLIIE